MKVRGVKILDDRIANPAYVLLFVTGAAMVFLGRLSWTTPWLLAALVLYACVAARGTALGIVLAVLVVLIVFLMVTKPDLWG